MSAGAGWSRDQLREAWCAAWRKWQQRIPLTGQEAQIVAVVELHPEYQPLLSDAQAALGYDPDPHGGAHNPFLHMGLHMAVREQVAVDRPPGVRELHRRLTERHGGAHGAEHAMMEALAEVLFEAQRSGRPPDEQAYLALAGRGLTS